MHGEKNKRMTLWGGLFERGGRHMVTHGEMRKCYNEMRQEEYFYTSSLDVIGRHLLQRFFGEGKNPFKMTFPEIRDEYIRVFQDQNPPMTEGELYDHICRRHLLLKEPPREALLRLYLKATGN